MKPVARNKRNISTLDSRSEKFPRFRSENHFRIGRVWSHALQHDRSSGLSVKLHVSVTTRFLYTFPPPPHHLNRTIEIIKLSFVQRLSTTFTDDHGWPYVNGSFSGLTGILQKEESDFGTAGSLMRLDRMTAMDFTVGTVLLK